MYRLIFDTAPQAKYIPIPMDRTTAQKPMPMRMSNAINTSKFSAARAKPKNTTTYVIPNSPVKSLDYTHRAKHLAVSSAPP
jgi:hypothetical protein